MITIVKNTKEGFEKKHVKDIKIFLKKKKAKGEKKAWDRYQNLFEEENEKKRQYHHERNKNVSEEKKGKKVDYMTNYYLVHKK